MSIALLLLTCCGTNAPKSNVAATPNHNPPPQKVYAKQIIINDSISICFKKNDVKFVMDYFNFGYVYTSKTDSFFTSVILVYWSI